MQILREIESGKDQGRVLAKALEGRRVKILRSPHFYAQEEEPSEKEGIEGKESKEGKEEGIEGEESEEGQSKKKGRQGQGIKIPCRSWQSHPLLRPDWGRDCENGGFPARWRACSPQERTRGAPPASNLHAGRSHARDGSEERAGDRP